VSRNKLEDVLFACFGHILVSAIAVNSDHVE